MVQELAWQWGWAYGHGGTPGRVCGVRAQQGQTQNSPARSEVSTLGAAQNVGSAEPQLGQGWLFKLLKI